MLLSVCENYLCGGDRVGGTKEVTEVERGVRL